MTAETPAKPYVGWPATETEANSLLQALLEKVYEAQQKRLAAFLEKLSEVVR